MTADRHPSVGQRCAPPQTANTCPAEPNGCVRGAVTPTQRGDHVTTAVVERDNYPLDWVIFPFLSYEGFHHLFTGTSAL